MLLACFLKKNIKNFSVLHIWDSVCNRNVLIHLDKTSITTKWTAPIQIKQPSKITQRCACQTDVSLLHRTHKRAITAALFLLCTDKQQFPESPSPPWSRFTWSLGALVHMSEKSWSEDFPVAFLSSKLQKSYMHGAGMFLPYVHAQRRFFFTVIDTAM